MLAKLFLFALLPIPLFAVSGPWDNPPASPDGPGQNGQPGTIVNVSSVSELINAADTLADNQTILIAPGVYNLTQPVRIGNLAAVTNVAIKGSTGNRNDVVILGSGMSIDGNADFCIQVFDGDTVLIADLTVGECWYHPLQFAGGSGAEAIHVYNCRLFNAGEQFVKSSNWCDNCIVEYCVIEYTTTSRWWYTQGVDVHEGQFWTVRYNLFRNIRGPAGDPDVGAAILFWDDSREPLIEGNLIYNCRMAIRLGISDVAGNECTAGIIRNNFIYRQPGAVNNPDSGIMIWDSPSVDVLHNTVILSQTGGSPIEYRWSSAVEIRNNLVDAGAINDAIWKREGDFASLSDNITDAALDLFMNPVQGDLHIKDTAINVIDQVTVLANCPADYDGDTRPGTGADIGADEYDAGYVPDPTPSGSSSSSGGCGPLTGAYTGILLIGAFFRRRRHNNF